MGEVKAARGSRRVAHVPELAAQWHPSRNGDLRPDEVALYSHRRIWWLCPVSPDHEWDIAPYARVKRPGACPYCSGQRVCASTSLAAVLPDIAAEWHPEL